MKVLVTGSSRGLGRAIITEFAKNHYDVIINYNKSFKAANALKKALQKYNVNIDVYKCDISCEEEVKEMFNKIDHLDILINNAAIALDNDLINKSAEEFNKVIETNLTGTFLVTKYAIPKINKGSIVNISSTNAIDTYYPESIDYDASKAGIISLTHNFSLYLPNVRVNCICPDWILTDMNKEMDPLYKQKIKFLTPEEVALIVYKTAINSKLNNQIIRIGDNHER